MQERLEPHILAIEGDPRPHGCRKLSAPLEGYRIWGGDYRVVYQVDDAARIVFIHKIAPRDGVCT
jgi:mRNA interferase RelE/StbE